MAIQPRQRWFLKQWLKKRGFTYQKFADRLGTSKGVISDLANGKERYHRDHLWEFAEILECEAWQLIEHNPAIEPVKPVDGIVSIEQTVRRIPEDQRMHALTVAQNVLEAFAKPAPPATPQPEPKAVPKKKRA